MSKLDHAERNKTLSDALFKEGVYYDWCVTTAFYSAIHFVEHKFFPQTIYGRTCTNLSDACDAYGIPGKHQAREKLVFDFADTEIGAYYKWLDDQSRNARYKTYKVNKAFAEKAGIYLEKIAQFCR